MDWKRIFFHKHIFLVLLMAPLNMYPEEKFPWVVYYNVKAPSSAFDPYNPIILDSDFYPDLPPILQEGKVVLGYIDLAEAEEWRSHFEKVKKWGILIRENPDWPGSWIVDIRDRRWKRLVLNTIIPNILKKGFNGLFYDQLDVAIALEQEDPDTYSGMINAAVDLVKAIHREFPKVRKMMNRAYEIIPQVGDSIDYELGETLYTIYDFETKTYHLRSPEEFAWGLSQLNAGRKKFPHLVIFSLDYWDPSDTEMYKHIYEVERSHCLRPYVSTISLDEIIPEPPSSS